MRQIPLSIFGRSAKTVVETKETEEIKVEEPVKEPETAPTPVDTVAETVEEAVVEEVKEPEPQKEEPAPEPEPEKTDTIVAEEVKEEPKDTVEEVKEEVKAETETAEEEKDPAEEEPKKKRATKKTVAAEAQVSMKMTGATKLMDATALVVPEYEDPSYAEFMEHMNEALLHTVFDERADAGTIKMILSNLSRCYDNATRKYAEIYAKLETVANKSYGLIMRQTAANYIGNNDAERKRNGLHAPEVYKGAGGKVVNLFAVEAGLRKEATEIQMIIKQIEFKKSAIIGYLTAIKQDSDV